MAQERHSVADIWTRQWWHWRFHQIRRMFCPAERLQAYQDKTCRLAVTDH